MVEGTVVIEGRIGEDGVPSALEVTAPVHPQLAKAALESVGQWRFEPARQDGYPLERAAEGHDQFQVIRCVGAPSWRPVTEEEKRVLQQRAIVAMVSAGSGCVATPTAQAPAGDADHPTFDSASESNPTKAGDGRVGLRGQPGGVLTAFNVTTAGADSVRVPRAGVSDCRRARFDPAPIGSTSTRRAGANVPPGQGQLMMQALLADRFKLDVHKDRGSTPITRS